MRSKPWREKSVLIVGVAAVAAALAVATTSAFAVSGSDRITTIAGIGKHEGSVYYGWGFSGDGGPAKAAKLAVPTGVAVDAKGNVYIGVFSNERVRMVNPAGTITTIAGSGVTSYGGFSGDGGPATLARLDRPWGVAVDVKGNVYIADQGNDRVRKVNPAGTITTIAGMGRTPNGTTGFSGDGGPATSALLHSPTGVAVDAKGNVYIADLGNQVVRKVNPGGTITTIAGRGEVRGFSGDGGPATSALMSSPSGVALDSKGNLYIADSGNDRVRKVSPGGKITTIAGSNRRQGLGDGGRATSAQLNQPGAVAVDGHGNVYIADYANWRVRKVGLDGTITTVAGNGGEGFSGDGGRAASAQVPGPNGVAVDGQGSLYITDHGNARVRKVWNLIPISSFTASSANGQAPLAVRFDASGSRDPNGSISSYAWDFGDGTTGTGKRTSHSYKSAGNFTVKLKVTDDSGGVSKPATRTVTVTRP